MGSSPISGSIFFKGMLRHTFIFLPFSKIFKKPLDKLYDLSYNKHKKGKQKQKIKNKEEQKMLERIRKINEEAQVNFELTMLQTTQPA